MSNLEFTAKNIEAAKPPDIMRDTIEKAAKKRVEMLENLAVEFLNNTGLKPEEVELVEENRGYQIVWYFRKKGSGR